VRVRVLPPEEEVGLPVGPEVAAGVPSEEEPAYRGEPLRRGAVLPAALPQRVCQWEGVIQGYGSESAKSARNSGPQVSG
jgi:hypothetical protein